MFVFLVIFFCIYGVVLYALVRNSFILQHTHMTGDPDGGGKELAGCHECGSQHLGGWQAGARGRGCGDGSGPGLSYVIRRFFGDIVEKI